jgi:hypothetical protein
VVDPEHLKNLISMKLVKTLQNRSEPSRKEDRGTMLAQMRK